MNDIEKTAGILYEEYCKQVSGRAFNGDQLPDWIIFRNDPLKQKQSNAWIVVAQKAHEIFYLESKVGNKYN